MGSTRIIYRYKEVLLPSGIRISEIAVLSNKKIYLGLYHYLHHTYSGRYKDLPHSGRYKDLPYSGRYKDLPHSGRYKDLPYSGRYKELPYSGR